MKKMATGIAIIFLQLPSISLATTNTDVKTETSSPHYNCGFTFGLADYIKILPPATDCNHSFLDTRDQEKKVKSELSI